MMEIPYKAKFVYVLGYPLFTPLSSSLHHCSLKEAKHKSPNLTLDFVLQLLEVSTLLP